jgi:hypothetical protein
MSRAMEEALGTPPCLNANGAASSSHNRQGQLWHKHARIVTLQVEHMRGDLNGYAKPGRTCPRPFQ